MIAEFLGVRVPRSVKNLRALEIQTVSPAVPNLSGRTSGLS